MYFLQKTVVQNGSTQNESQGTYISIYIVHFMLWPALFFFAVV